MYKEYKAVLTLTSDKKSGTVQVDNIFYTTYDLREKSKGRYYVSFYGPANYLCWANYVTPGTEFTAKQTNKYRYTIGGSRKPAQQIRIDKATHRYAKRAMRGNTVKY